MYKQIPKTKTEINRIVARHLHINSQEAAWLVSNAIRDGIIIEIRPKRRGRKKKKRGRTPKRYMVVRRASDIDSEIRELY